MRRKVAVALVAMLVVLSFAEVAFAAHMITGKVISANPSAKTLMLNSRGVVITFSVADKAVNDLADLTPGSKVGVHYTQAAGEQPQVHEVFPWPVGG